MNEKEILEHTRDLIKEHAGNDPDKWWYVNRFVFARLQLDERKTKASIKQQLLDAEAPCHGCGKPFESKKDVHLHRLDGARGYSEDNCVLMHAECHREHHASTEQEASEETRRRKIEPEKSSKRYDDKPFLYWWDISPSLAEALDEFEVLEFIKKDTGERCAVPIQALRGFLTPERQTTRGQGNWGIKVMKDHPDELGFEPGAGDSKWVYLPAVWLSETED